MGTPGKSSLRELLRGLVRLGPEIAVGRWVARPHVEAGVVSFEKQVFDGRMILHADRDVLALVLQGRGAVRVGEEEWPLEAGDLCDVPAGTPHDFRATGDEPLRLFYVQLRAASPGELAGTGAAPVE
jgi:mannose-6-phosphate isomerase-like protein (cupin superfamily)